MKIKLSDKQKEVINMMRIGWFGENCVTNSESAYMAKEDFRGKKINISNFHRLEKQGLIIKLKRNFALYRYYLTELGKTIQL